MGISGESQVAGDDRGSRTTRVERPPEAHLERRGFPNVTLAEYRVTMVSSGERMLTRIRINSDLKSPGVQ